MIVYEPHPVSPERKAELRAAGFQIVDALFMPEGWANPEMPSNPFDKDGDGEFGGSLPADKRGLDDLRAEAESLGIAVDKRWGEKRLMEAINGANN